jgi:exodeoxyribonuclease VII large subunit
MVATGKLTTFPGRSRYQIVVEHLEPAGEGALMALLEERRKKLQAEGLFDTARKKPIPYLPRIIGVVTSPTGAVIRDILHRLEDRFPRRVLVWPVRVQGETSSEEVAAAIRGFNALPPGGAIPRPDVLIVARGGGSLEDLWGFNEEVVVRAAAESAIPLVAAIGHETDWTLIDLAADVRAPTPTGAAEMVVPVRSELLATVDDLARRHAHAILRVLERRRADLRSAARALPGPDALFAAKRQRLDLAAAKLKPALRENARDHHRRFEAACRSFLRFSPAHQLTDARSRLQRSGERLGPAFRRLMERRREWLKSSDQRLAVGRDTIIRAERVRLTHCRQRLADLGARSAQAIRILRERRAERVNALHTLLNSLGYKAVLARGYALVRDGEGHPLRSVAHVAPGQALAVEFADGTITATADGVKQKRRPTAEARQGSLFDS